ncbi:MAG: IS200/IS605 family transposase [Prolixibacteraceae bacterium]|jgi:REP element-mobilizing transposase RayT|nr:IS200/IS605 family transposase [Prolixibacteraceae bacterium]
MSQSLSKIYVHITFSTKNRRHIIDEAINTRLYDYLGGICKGLGCNPVRIGGHTDHVHILCLMSRKIAPMQLLEQVKKRSSKWVKTQGEKYAAFYWQDGYGIFSVNPAETSTVVEYINRQAAHHQKRTFQDEYRAFLKKYAVDYDERYVWD